MKKETRAYEMVVKYHNEIDQAPDYIEFIVLAKSMAKAEKKAMKECGDSFISVHSIEAMEASPIF